MGTLFLLILLLLTGGAGIYFTTSLKSETQAILQDNYKSVDYCHAMQQQLENISFHQSLFSLFDSSLTAQEHNITEPGELAATRSLRNDFEQLKAGDSSKQTIINIQKEIQRIISLNMSAIHNKDEHAKKIADKAVKIIISLSVLVFIIAFLFSYNFPSIVINPINKLSVAIKEISNKNYCHRINVDSRNEFGTLANAFNDMAERLEHFESSNLNKLMFEKTRAEAVINSLKDASIGIDKNNVILFANFQALQLLGLKASEVVGNTVEQLSKVNDLFNFLMKNDIPALLRS